MAQGRRRHLGPAALPAALNTLPWRRLGGLCLTALCLLTAWAAWRRDWPEPEGLPHQLARPQGGGLIERAMAAIDPSAGTGLPSGHRVRLDDEHWQAVKPTVAPAEARLIEVYRLIGSGQTRQALAQSTALVRDHPNFQLAQLVHGDLLSLQIRPVRQLGDVADTQAIAARHQLAALREESHRRLQALAERPPAGAIPTAFLELAPSSRHAIAVDASRSRLYLFENTSHPDADGAPALRLIADFYISVGLAGIDKTAEGDKRTPLGVYYITSTLDPDSLPDLYGAGALPLNYPNALDVQRGKTGSGIWLHGTPSDQFVRAPQASDGCVVLSNPDLKRLLETVQIRSTPVVIAPRLEWADPTALADERASFASALENWRRSRSERDLATLKGLYSSRFQQQGVGLAQWWPRLEAELSAQPAREIRLKERSMLRWRDHEEVMVVTFGEVPAGQVRGQTRRQYWVRENDRWSIVFEGVI